MKQLWNKFEVCLEYIWRSFEAVLKHFKAFWSNLSNFEASWSNVEAFWNILKLFETFKILKGFEGIWRVLNHFERFWSILKDFEAIWSILRFFKWFWRILQDFERFWRILKHSARFPDPKPRIFLFVIWSFSVLSGSIFPDFKFFSKIWTATSTPGGPAKLAGYQIRKLLETPFLTTTRTLRSETSVRE